MKFGSPRVLVGVHGVHWQHHSPATLCGYCLSQNLPYFQTALLTAHHKPDGFHLALVFFPGTFWFCADVPANEEPAAPRCLVSGDKGRALQMAQMLHPSASPSCWEKCNEINCVKPSMQPSLGASDVQSDCLALSPTRFSNARRLGLFQKMRRSSRPLSACAWPGPTPGSLGFVRNVPKKRQSRTWRRRNELFSLELSIKICINECVPSF